MAPLFNEVTTKLTLTGRQQLLEKVLRKRHDKLKAGMTNLIFKLPYSPRGVRRQDVTAAFHSSGLAKLIPDRRLICAQLKSFNIRDRVSSTTLEDIPQGNPSDFLNF